MAIPFVICIAVLFFAHYCGKQIDLYEEHLYEPPVWMSLGVGAGSIAAICLFALVLGALGVFR